jgi:hypothetical protein
MRRKELRRYAKVVLFFAAVLSCGATVAHAETSSSSHYKVTDTDFNAISNTKACSSQYCAKVSLGDASSDTATSPASTAQFGTIATTDSDPLLEVIVDPGVSNLGTLSTETTAYKTMMVRVRTYLSDGYVLQVVGSAPKYGNHSLSTLATPTSPAAGTEQFGINAIANTTPAVGADPLLVPSNQSSLSSVTDDYKMQNKFKYVSGDEVARNNAASGRTDYTVSMIVNISNATPAGHYSGDFSAVVTPLY